MKPEVKFGLLLGLGICVYTMLAHVFGFYTTNIGAGKYGDIAVTLLPIMAIYFAIRERRNRQGSLTLWQGIVTGVLVALISFPLSTAFLWVYHHYINPNWLDYIINYEQSNMTRAGANANEISARLNALRAGNSDSAQVVGGLVGTTILGLALSFIISLLLKRKP